MAASYVVVTAAAVLLVEAVAIVAVLPGLLSQLDFSRRVDTTAVQLAGDASRVNQASDGLKLPTDYFVGDPAVDPTTVTPLGQGLAIPHLDGKAPKTAVVAVILDRNGVILASSWTLPYPAGQTANGLLPTTKLSPNTGVTKASNGPITWAMEPIVALVTLSPDIAAAKGDKGAPLQKQVVGWVYVQAPGNGLAGPFGLGNLDALANLPNSSIGPLIGAGALLLLLLLPIGAGFGVLTSRRLVHRLAGLAAATGDFAAGDLGRRVRERGDDEVGRVERGFNEMAGRIEAMTVAQARLIDEKARIEERARIARELHDSISQDLFSISLLAGGLQKALPPDSSLQAQVAAMRDTVGGTLSEMRALLLELRPAALDERGLVPALQDLVTAYQERLGVTVDARLEPIQLAPPIDHAVLRVAQEGIANAVRHADARHISLRLSRRGSRAELVVADDGRGFDGEAATGGHGFGLRVMKERVRELGGSLEVRSRPGRGTRLVALIPGA